MIVTFVSQCEKKSLSRTRRILDAFANRIGDNVWQTAITEDGLQTVKQLLRKSATKSTAVSCHRNKTRQLTEVVWIVGNKRKFNEVGVVPVNRTNEIFYIVSGKMTGVTPVVFKSSLLYLPYCMTLANQPLVFKKSLRKVANKVILIVMNGYH